MRAELEAGTAEIVAVDLGGTTVRAALVDAAGTLRAQVKEPLRYGQAPEQVVELMSRVARCGDATSAVVGLPGRVDHVEGRLHVARNLPATELEGLSARRLSHATGLDVELAGDAELAAVGEAHFGAGSPRGTMAYLTFSTGVGAAAITEGRVLSGRVAGFQIGFLPLLGSDHEMLDALASGQRVRAAAEELGRDVDYGGLTELAAQLGGAAQRTEARSAARARLDIFEATAAAAILMCHVCSPDVLVIGGGLARAAGDEIVRGIDRRIRDAVTSHVSWDVRVRPAQHGDDAGLIGAAAWARARPVSGRESYSQENSGKEAFGELHR